MTGRKMPLRVDIFCNVIDHFGDAGVCWRLARQLAHEYGFQVRLWIDKPAVLQQIAPGIGLDEGEQTVSHVAIRFWPSSFPILLVEDIPDVVIEGFGARLPKSYVRQMAEKPSAPVWINLEYLSAESWVETTHLMPSPQSWIPLTKYFYFPGFTQKTGGLIRETDLLKRRDHFQHDRDHAMRFLSSIGIRAQKDQLLVSLFCYPNAPVTSLLNMFKASHREIVCLVPEGVAVDAIQSFMNQPALAGTTFVSGSLHLYILPMLEQTQYDYLLWSCDLNFVRGEDSFVRAQWAARPFVWQIYPQEEQGHWVKLDAFLEQYLIHFPKKAAAIAVWYAWNQIQTGGIHRKSWETFLDILPQLNAHALNWSKKMADRENLASGLVRFINTLR